MLYENDDFQVLDRPGNNRNEVWITFSYAGARYGVGEFFLKPRECDLVHIIAKRDHWYQSPYIWPVLQAILHRTSQQNRYLFGSSMGGFGALAYSAFLQPKAILSVCPQVLLDQPQDFDGRWHGLWSGLPPIRKDARIGLSRNARVYIVSDPYLWEDRHHVDALKDFGNVRRLEFPFGDHEIMATLNELRQWQTIADRIVTENENFEDLRAAYMANRRSTSRYYHALARRFFVAGKYDKAEPLLRKAVSIDDTFRYGHLCLEVCESKKQAAAS